MSNFHHFLIFHTMENPRETCFHSVEKPPKHASIAWNPRLPPIRVWPGGRRAAPFPPLPEAERQAEKRRSSDRNSLIFNGLEMWPFMPALRDFSLSSSKALAEKAMIFILSPPGSFRMAAVAW